MSIQFTKMHGLGNDFMVMDATQKPIHLRPEQIAMLSNRHTGIGFDQCLLIEKSNNPKVDFFYRIFNADGQEVGQCGNGARCLARFIAHQGLSTKKKLVVRTSTTEMTLHLNPDDSVTVDMGYPKTHPKDIPLLAEVEAPFYALPLKHQKIIQVHAIQVGNPHAVMVVSDLNLIQTLGQQIAEHPLFPEQTNANFMQIIHPHHIHLRVYERGCGETLACGSGAVASVAVGRLFHHLAPTVKVTLPGGDLMVNWPNFNAPISLTGPATFVYEGSLLCEL